MKSATLLKVASVVIFISAAVVPRGLAQDSNAPKPSSAAQADSSHAYRADFTLTETEDGKKIDSRQYSFSFGTNGSGGVSIGTRVPTSTKTDGTISYLDASTSINGRLSERAGGPMLDVNCSVTSVVPGQDPSRPPVLRTLSINNSTPLVLGKQIVVGVADDPNSRAQFELDVNLTQTK
jgi:hypothetical protein